MTMNVNEICAAILKMNDIEEVRSMSKRLNEVIKARYSELQRHKAYTLGVGMKVEFNDKNGNIVTGKITKINAKTVEVRADVSSMKWRVTPSLLRAAA